MRPPRKLAGIDYNVGIDRSVYPTNASLKNPNTLTKQTGSSPNPFEAGISWFPSNGSGWPNTIYINGSNLVLEGYDLTLGGGWVVQVMSGDSNTVSNCYFNWPASGGVPQQPRGNTNYYVQGIAVPQADDADGMPSTATNTIITKCFLDGTNTTPVYPEQAAAVAHYQACGGLGPGQELVEAIVKPEIDQAGEDIGEPSLRVDVR